MSVEFTNDCESAPAVGPWTDISGTAPTVTATGKHAGSYGVLTNWSDGANFMGKNLGSAQASSAVRFYLYLLGDLSNNANFPIVQVFNPAESRWMMVCCSTDGSANPTFKSRIWDGTTNHDSTGVSVSKATLYRVEAKFDASGSAWKMTWGYAAGDAALTTVDTDFTGTNSIGAGTLLYHRWGVNGLASDWRIVYDDIALANSGADYPIGSTITLDTVLPDADVTTTGWSTAPLFSKINDASDATVISATAS